ncbi:MAG: hypothetical protein AAAFM81_03810 [Pseudomonadota bacterium]
MSDTQGDNVRALHAPRKEVSFPWQLGRYRLYYDETTLFIEWQLNGKVRLTRHDLLLLSPLFIEDGLSLDTLTPELKSTGGWLAGSVIVWFSALRDAVPLLAPALFLLGCAAGIRLAMAYRSRGARTVICESGGDEIIDIPHARIDSDQRQGFEAGLKKAIERVHERWRDGEI